jgi:hypothetical protein
MTKLLEKRKEERKINKDIVVLYHANCTDGFCAAWAAWKKFGDSADYVGINPGTAPLSSLVDKEIYTVDLTFSTVYIPKLVKENKRLTSIDHHLTGEKEAAMTYDYLFDLKHSGAVLSWQYFHPNKKVPKLLNYVEDFDLWLFKLPYTKEIVSYLDLFDFDFKVWDSLITDFDDPKKFKKILPQAKLLLLHEKKLIERIVNNDSELVEFEGYRTYAVNCPIFGSQIGNVLYGKLPPMSIVWYRDKNRLKFGLRSDGSVNVSELAKKFGGGGHKGSSGFALPIGSPFPWKKIDEK